MARLSPGHWTLAQELWLERPGLVLERPLERALGQEPERALERALERGGLLLEQPHLRLL